MVMVPIILFAHDIFFDSDSESEVEAIDHSKKYFLELIKSMNTYQFKRHFRMDCETFEDLLQKLHLVYEFPQFGHPEIPLEESLFIKQCVMNNYYSHQKMRLIESSCRDLWLCL